MPYQGLAPMYTGSPGKIVQLSFLPLASKLRDSWKDMSIFIQSLGAKIVSIVNMLEKDTLTNFIYSIRIFEGVSAEILQTYSWHDYYKSINIDNYQIFPLFK